MTSYNPYEGDRDLDSFKGEDWRGRVFQGKYDNRYGGGYNSGGGNYSNENDDYSYGDSKRSKGKIAAGSILGLLVIGIIFGISSGMIDINNIEGILGSIVEAAELSEPKQKTVPAARNTQETFTKSLIISEKIEFVPYNEKEESVITYETTNSPVTPNTITYKYSTPPYVAKKQIVYPALDKAISNWENANPELDFEHTYSLNADIVIKWQIYSSTNHDGLAEIKFINGEQIIGKGEINASLGASNCKGEFVQHDSDKLTNILMHEIGHIMGLGHHMDKSHLMYGPDLVENPYDTRGYQIPKRLDDYFVGYKSLKGLADSYKEEIDDLQNGYDQLYAQFQKYEGKELPPDEYDIAIKILNELDRLGSKLDKRIDYYNEVVENLNCFPNTGVT